MKKRWIIPVCIVLILISIVMLAIQRYTECEQIRLYDPEPARSGGLFVVFHSIYTGVILVSEIDMAYNICWLVLAPKPRHKLRLILNCIALTISALVWIAAVSIIYEPLGRIVSDILEYVIAGSLYDVTNITIVGGVIACCAVRLVSLGLLAWQSMFAREHNKTQGASRVENERSEDA